jgi:hypothetical protein
MVKIKKLNVVLNVNEDELAFYLGKGFEKIGEETKAPDSKPEPTKNELLKQAEELGIEIKGNPNKADIQALIDDAIKAKGQ